jgi:hypothetical protein
MEPALALKVFEALSSEAGQQVKAKGIDMLGKTGTVDDYAVMHETGTTTG